MEQKRIPEPGQLYRHFKNNLYQIITVAAHSETSEKMVVYQALYGNFKTYVRPLAMFISEVDHEKYPDVKQKYRFEPVILSVEEESDMGRSTQVPEESGSPVPDTGDPYEIKISEDRGSQTDIAALDGSINPVLLEFLEADTYVEKLDILLYKKKYINDKILNDMAVSIDCTVDDGDLEERISEFAFCLQTHARFESNRLR